MEMEKVIVLRYVFWNSEWGKRSKGLEFPVVQFVSIHKCKAEDWSQMIMNNENPG